jgi:osmoprotectant transport system ATP-binding protein
MIELHNVSKRFDTKTVLDRIDLHLATSRTHVLLGISGCGKSTLLRIIMGLTSPDSGRILIAGTELTAQNQPELVQRIGYVIQDGGLFPHLTAENNVTLLAKVLGENRGWGDARIRSRLAELASLVGFEPSILKRYPKELSGGQRQRVALMRALMLDPPLLLLDEPLGALDPIVRSALRNELKAIFNRLGKTVLIVTHDLDEAAFFGHTITLMHDGRIEQHGELGELAQKPASPFVTEFINAQKPSRWFQEIFL